MGTFHEETMCNSFAQGFLKHFRGIYIRFNEPFAVKLSQTPFLVMVYTSPTKVAQVVHFKKLDMNNTEIAKEISIHCTSIAHILNCFEKSADPYYVNPKTGCPCKM